MKRPEKTADPAHQAHLKRTSTLTPDSAFTETFLSRISNEEDLAAVRHVGKMLYSAAIQVDGGIFDGPQAYVASLLRATVAELRRLEAELAYIGKSPKHGVIETPSELKLCRMATQKAFAVAKIADALEQEIGPRPDRGKKDTSSPW